jgi:hypothetical protein
MLARLSLDKDEVMEEPADGIEVGEFNREVCVSA